MKKGEFVLVDTLQEKKGKAFKYFKKMTGIGPMTTDDISQAEKFSSKQESYQSPAYAHCMCFFEPVEVENA
jgi:hypothetical protein